MPTVREVLGDEVNVLQNQGKNYDEIVAIAKEKYKLNNAPPPQPIVALPPEKQKTYVNSIVPFIGGEETPKWFRGDSDSTLLNQTGDFVRGVSNTAFNYANTALGVVNLVQNKLHEYAPGVVSKSENDDYYTNLLQKLETYDGQRKAQGRTQERQSEVDLLEKEAAQAEGAYEKIESGVESLWDTATNPQEWSVGGIASMAFDPANAAYLGKSIYGAIAAGAALNAFQAGSFAAARTDKDTDDVIAEATLGGVSGLGFGLGVNLAGKGVAKIAKAIKKDTPETVVDTHTDEDGMVRFDIQKEEAQAYKEQYIQDETIKEFSEVFKVEEQRVKDLDSRIKEVQNEAELQGKTEEEMEVIIGESFPPSETALKISSILNDGQVLTPRLNGSNMTQVIINTIENSPLTPQQFHEKIIVHGATAEHANVATRAYATKNIAHYTSWAIKKLADNKDILVDTNKIETDAQVKVSEKFGIDKDTKEIIKRYQNDIEKDLSLLQNHERYSEVLDFSREVNAKDGVNPQRLESPRSVSEVDGPSELKSTFEEAEYSQNYNHDFVLTKAKVKRIEDGKATTQDIEDLQADLRMLEENPTYANTPHYVLEENIDAEQAFSSGSGNHGPMIYEYRGDYKGALNKLIELQDGEAIGALHHKNIGPIDLVWGKEGTGHSDGYGLAKLVKYHPEVVKNLDVIVAGMDIVKSSKNRMILESKDHKAAISLKWMDKEKTWLLSSYEKAPTHSRTDSVSDKSELTTSDGTKESTFSSIYGEGETVEPTTSTRHTDSIAQDDTNSNKIIKRYQKDIKTLSSESEIFMGKDGQGNDLYASYKDLDAELEADAAIIKRIEDCIL